MHKFLDTYGLIKWKQVDVKTLNDPTTVNELEALFQKPPTKKNPVLDVSLLNSMRMSMNIYYQYSSNSNEIQRENTQIFLWKLTLAIFRNHNIPN